ncbi:MAG TPA: MBL fold metallo-hydrolase [Gaiellaceae bacterium]
MRLKIWGCRGSVATPGPETVRYGGNTSCIEVMLGGGDTTLVLDAGTGIRELGEELEGRGARRIHICLTHLHLDHLEGLRFFAPLWNPDVSVEIWGPPSPVLSLQERIARYFSPPLFPVDLRDVPAALSFHDVPKESWSIDGASLTADLVVHPGPTIGYRIETPQGSVGYIPDHEPALVGPIGSRPPDWISGSSIAAGVDALLHDAQYFEDEYTERVGWGHSSVADAVAFARAVGAKRLVLFHHEPNHTDDELERLEARAHALVNGDDAPPCLAHEGMVVEVP